MGWPIDGPLSGYGTSSAATVCAEPAPRERYAAPTGTGRHLGQLVRPWTRPGGQRAGLTERGEAAIECEIWQQTS